MVKYYADVRMGDIYKVDLANESFEVLRYNNMIDYIYYVPEDGNLEITLKDGSKKTIGVDKGDIVLKMYSATGDYADKEYFVIRHPEIEDYVRRREEFKTEMLKKRADSTYSLDLEDEVCCCEGN